MKTYAFRQYLYYLNMQTPDELLLMDNATAQKKIIGYILYLKNEKGLSYSSLEGVCAPLRKFYAMNDVMLNWDKMHAYLGEHVAGKNRPRVTPHPSSVMIYSLTIVAVAIALQAYYFRRTKL